MYICNLHNGVDHYTFPQLTLARSFPQPIGHNIPLHISTAFGGDLIVVGGDRGVVRVFNAATGTLVTSLIHDPEGKFCQAQRSLIKLISVCLGHDRVQAVAVCTCHHPYLHQLTKPRPSH